MELQVASRDTDTDTDFSSFSVKEMDCAQMHVYKIKTLYFYCMLLVMDFKCDSGI